jgi:hypothetical protein
MRVALAQQQVLREVGFSVADVSVSKHVRITTEEGFTFICGHTESDRRGILNFRAFARRKARQLGLTGERL